MFAQARAATVTGRDDVVSDCTAYIGEPSLGQLSPLVLHGPSGLGKSSVLAAVHQQHVDSSNGILLLVRFVGHTPSSRSINALLTSMHAELLELLGPQHSELTQAPPHLSGPDQFFWVLNQVAALSLEVVVILDALDVLLDASCDQSLHWLPMQLPKSVHWVVSIIDQGPYEPAFQRLATHASCVQLSELSLETAEAYLSTTLTRAGRTLHPEQRKMVMAGFQHDPSTLHLQLLVVAAQRLASTAVHRPGPQTLHGALCSVFEAAEQDLGTEFVGAALSYITLSREGLTMSELEDVLSCNDRVLDAVYAYWQHPRRRIPDLMVARLFRHFDSFLVGE